MATGSGSSATLDMAARWQSLAHAIAAPPEKPSGDRGELTIIGSGMAHIDLTINDEQLIVSADVVFHCLYDRVTQIWLGELRPDAFDLRILYRPDVDRYITYVQMTEALLYHVRQGRKVLAIYYGHPGIFATPAHRAVRIARREGHHAQMRPGISALDYLVADVGFDPMMPGLLSFEASDLLLRKRHIDPSLHVVLWQVGVVGEFQFNPAGFKNRGFGLLVDELVAVYGCDWEVTNYIASQYVGVEPLIERHAIGTLAEPDVRKRFTASSTLYIEPRVAVATDKGRAIALGFGAPGEPPPPAEREYEIAAYGPREQAAIHSFATFVAPEHYRLPEPSPAHRFMLALSQEPELRARFRDNPVAVLAEPRFSQLNERARELLTMAHPLAINAAIAEAAAPSTER